MSVVFAQGSGPQRPWVIGVGNEARGDDGAGLRVTRELALRIGDRAEFVECAGGVAELLDLWEGKRLVYLVDALHSGREPGSWLRVVVGDGPLPSAMSGTSTHGLSIASAVGLGQVLGRLPTRLVLFGIEAARFDAGAELSPAVLQGVRGVTRVLAEEIEHGEPAEVNPRRG
jgi:hydrogenase maturation protease